MENANKSVSPETDDDDIEAEEKTSEDSSTKKKGTALHHVPLSRAVKTSRAEEKPEKEKGHFTFGEDFFEKMGIKPLSIRKEDAAKDAIEADRAESTETTEESADEQDTSVTTPGELNAHSLIENAVKSEAGTSDGIVPSAQLAEVEPLKPHIDEATTNGITPTNKVAKPVLKAARQSPPLTVAPAMMEAANWESEGELGDAGEIPLAAARPGGEEDPHPPASYEARETPEEPPVDKELFDRGLGAEGPPRPPDPPEGPPRDDFEDDPSDPGVGPAARFVRLAPTPDHPWYDAAAADRLAVEHEREVEIAAHDAEKHGLVRGLVLGWLLGRHGKKKQARGFRKELNQKDKAINSLKSNQLSQEQQLQSLKNKQERAILDAKAEAASQNQPARKEKNPVPVLIPAAEKNVQTRPQKLERTPLLTEVPKTAWTEKAHKIAEFVPMPQLERQELGKGKPYKTSEAPKTITLETNTAGTIAWASEARPSTHEKPATIGDTRELAPEDRPITEADYEVQKGTRVETSAWHRIEVDAKTGKPVENPEVAYGQEFKREQAKEVWHDDPVRGSSQATSQLGGLAASSSGATPSQATQYAGTGVSNNTSNAPAAPQSPFMQHASKGNELLRYASSPAVWVVAVVIVAVLFVIGILH